VAQIRDEGKINDHTYLIDAVHEGVSGGFAVYLLKSEDHQPGAFRMPDRR